MGQINFKLLKDWVEAMHTSPMKAQLDPIFKKIQTQPLNYLMNLSTELDIISNHIEEENRQQFNAAVMNGILFGIAASHAISAEANHKYFIDSLLKLRSVKGENVVPFSQTQKRKEETLCPRS